MSGYFSICLNKREKNAFKRFFVKTRKNIVATQKMIKFAFLLEEMPFY